MLLNYNIDFEAYSAIISANSRLFAAAWIWLASSRSYRSTRAHMQEGRPKESEAVLTWRRIEKENESCPNSALVRLNRAMLWFWNGLSSFDVSSIARVAFSWQPAISGFWQKMTLGKINITAVECNWNIPWQCFVCFTHELTHFLSFDWLYTCHVVWQ